MSTGTSSLLSVMLAARRRSRVLAVALIEVRRGLHRDLRGPRRRSPPRSRASRPSTCARSSRAVKAINAQFDVILGALPGIARKAAIVAERRPR